MFSRPWIVTGCLFIINAAGCSTFDRCNWWGRNTDGSSNWGKKPTPVQQGPLASTYSRPAATTYSPVQQPLNTTPAPVVTSSPVQVVPEVPAQAPNSVLTPSSQAIQAPHQSIPVAPPVSQTSDQSKPISGNFIPSTQLPSAGVSELPDNKPSIPSPTLPTPQVAGPTVPGASPVENQGMPLLLAQPSSAIPQAPSNSTPPLNIVMPEIAVPTIAKPMDLAAPKMSGGGKSNSLNPGTTPPPLPAPPVPPSFDGKIRK